MTRDTLFKGSLAIGLAFLLNAAPIVPAQAEETPEILPACVSLDGKPLPEGNPVEKELVRDFRAPALLLYRTHAATPLGTLLLLPGGGYRVLAVVHEGENTARFLNEQGFDVAMLEYHLLSAPEVRGLDEGAARRQTMELALADALQAFRLVRSGGAALGLHGGRFGIMGYSAGGHLATRTVQALDPAEQPDDLILGYPAYLDKRDLVVTPPPKSGRLFVVIGDKDNEGWIKGAEAYAAAWKEATGPATFQLLPNVAHGFGVAAIAPASAAHWTDLLAAFLQGKAMPPQ
ncbi:alpha/beta hydrolase fold [Verrucomicrobium sp. GAS474]|uniref:alpha/beta hydrolase n=1 Tax=Verrucomicrobium sp. GAS474 TaxID=1882831 RepID=UPI00087AC483|nr:alpha/beta hydrolase fold domain-containing protein [Verrucomicrobium sp. GAS474]SDT87092.1 alpha/beta hydrolase fold [Verrucomicrobium sp. GAS474]